MKTSQPHASAYPFFKAFTLIELLTVIAIVGILAAIMIPTIGKVRRMANDAQCKSSMRQWGVAMQLYVDDHKGQLPGPCQAWVRRYSHPISSTTPNHIFQFLAPYAGLKNQWGGLVPENMVCSGWVREAPSSAVKDGSGEVYCLKSPHTDWLPYGYTDGTPGNYTAPRFYSAALADSRITKSFAMIDLDAEYNVEMLGGSAKPEWIPQKAVHGNHWNILHWDWHISSKTKARLKVGVN